MYFSQVLKGRSSSSKAGHTGTARRGRRSGGRGQAWRLVCIVLVISIVDKLPSYLPGEFLPELMTRLLVAEAAETCEVAYFTVVFRLRFTPQSTGYAGKMSK